MESTWGRKKVEGIGRGRVKPVPRPRYCRDLAPSPWKNGMAFNLNTISNKFKQSQAKMLKACFCGLRLPQWRIALSHICNNMAMNFMGQLPRGKCFENF